MRRQRDSFVASPFKKVRADDVARLTPTEADRPAQAASIPSSRLTLPPAAARRSAVLLGLAFDLDFGRWRGPLGHRHGVGRFAFASRPLDPFMARSSLGGRAPTPVLLRGALALVTTGIAKVVRLRRRGARLTLPLAAFRTLTSSPTTTSTPPSAARFAVLAAILRGLRLPGLSGRGLALRLLLIHIGGFGKGGTGFSRLELRLTWSAALAAAAAGAASRLLGVAFGRDRGGGGLLVMGPVHLHHGALADADLRLGRTLDDELRHM